MKRVPMRSRRTVELDRADSTATVGGRSSGRLV